MTQLKDMTEPEIKQYLQMMAEMIEGVLPGGTGGKNGRVLFAFLIFDAGVGQYISNAERPGVIAAMRDLADALDTGQAIERVGQTVEPTATIKLLCDRLNYYLNIDRVSITATMLVRSPVALGSELLDDPEIVVATPNDEVVTEAEREENGLPQTPRAEAFSYSLSFLGLLNGLHGCQTHDIAMMLDTATNRLLEFQIVPRTK